MHMVCFKTSLMRCFFVLACRSEGNCSVFSIAETKELSGSHPEALCRHVGGWVVHLTIFRSHHIMTALHWPFKPVIFIHSLTTRREQKEYTLSSGSGLLPSSGESLLKGTAQIKQQSFFFFISQQINKYYRLLRTCLHARSLDDLNRDELSLCVKILWWCICVLSGWIGVVHTLTVSGGNGRPTAVRCQLRLQPPAHLASGHHGSHAADSHVFYRYKQQKTPKWYDTCNLKKFVGKL